MDICFWSLAKAEKCSRETEQVVCTKCQRQESVMPSENCTSSLSMTAAEDTEGREFWEIRQRTRAHTLSCWYRHCGLCWALFLGFYLVGCFFFFFFLYFTKFSILRHFLWPWCGLPWSQSINQCIFPVVIYLGKRLYGTQLPTYISCFSYLSLLFYP